MDEKLSKQIYAFKAICLLSIVLAHTPYHGVDNQMAYNFLYSFSQFGVVGFFIVSGYFFLDTRKSFSQFWKGKLFTIFIPWFVAASMNYFKTILHGGFGILNYFYYLIGNRNIFYFLSMLVLCYLLLWKFRKNNKVLLFVIILTAASKYLTFIGILPDSSVDMNPFTNPYLNVFNYLGLFAIGCLMKNRKSKLQESIGITKTLIGIVLVAGGSYLNGVSIYLDFFAWLMYVAGWLYLAYKLAFNYLYDVEHIVAIGKVTMTIYMYHLFLSTKFLTSDLMLNNWFAAVCRPFMIIAVIYAVIRALNIICSETKAYNAFKIITGIRL